MTAANFEHCYVKVEYVEGGTAVVSPKTGATITVAGDLDRFTDPRMTAPGFDLSPLGQRVHEWLDGEPKGSVPMSHRELRALHAGKES